MKVSHNELVSLCAKAYDSLKRECGEAENIANMVVDLEMAGMNGVSLFLSALASIEQEGDFPVASVVQDGETIIVDLSGASLLCHFPALIDVAVDQLIGEQHVQLHIRNCRNRWFGFSELLKLAGKGLSVRAQWVNGESPEFVDCVHNAGYRYPEVYFNKPKQIGISDLPHHDLLVDIQLAPFEDAVFEGEPSISSDMLMAAEAKAWKKGINVDESHWHALKKYVARGLVENSERSLQGAGE
ncbi:DUF3726 domain-containing protein [Enterovibrio makurazakiensis]|uniref:DUF3726 domain-containing protein n=1 Tax=Enterovibrio makurazakiensis TaxID=2910232 RepID=UPI003D195C9B